MRRGARGLAHANGFLWGLGNGLVSTSLATYLAREFLPEDLSEGGRLLAIALIVALPNLLGGLRLFSPLLLRLIPSRKWFAVLFFTLSAYWLHLIPLACDPESVAPIDGLWRLVRLWGAWHLAMYLAVIALWSWFGDLVEGESRGGFIGVRQAWLTAGQILGLLAAAVVAEWYPRLDPVSNPRYLTLAMCGIAGAWCMALAILPLIFIPPRPMDRARMTSMGDLLRAVVDRRYWPLLAFWCCAGLANGVTQTPQAVYPLRSYLAIPFSHYLAMQTLMFVGQIALSPWLGKLADRHGCRRIMIVSQVLVSLALVFYLVASPAQPYWIIGAWVLWIGYAGLNVCLPLAMLRLAPGENSPGYISSYFALGGLTMGLSTVAFGFLFDLIGRDGMVFAGGPFQCDRFRFLFIGGLLLRLACVIPLRYLPDTRISAAPPSPSPAP